MTTTIRDVAKKAGVSYTTVSRVLNNKNEITEETRKRVQEAMDELGYAPNPIARSLATNQTHELGFIVSDITNPFLADVARGIQRYAWEYGYSVTIIMTDSNQEMELEAIKFLIDRRADGIIITPPETDANNFEILKQAKKGHRFVLIGRHVEHENVSFVSTSTATGEYNATKYLISLGHRRIAHIQASLRMGYGRGKVSGYKKALEEAGIPFDPHLVVPSGFLSIEYGEKACEELLKLPQIPTAITATNDLVAIGALNAIKNAGLRVPDDISVVGFDDIIYAKNTRPPLTTVSQPALRLGTIAAHTLLQSMQSKPYEKETILDCELVVRESTGPVKK